MNRICVGCIMVLLVAVFGCEKPGPVIVGFSGDFSGKRSTLGLSGRDGVMLAVEKINGAGGIGGRPVVLFSKDDRNDPQTAVAVDRQLVAEGAVAIIGHMTSTMSMAAIPLINRSRIVMISPTTSTDDKRVTGVDDYFFRVMPTSGARAEYLARHAYGQMGLKRVTSVYDLANRDFTERWLRCFTDTFEEGGGVMVCRESFSSDKSTSYGEIARKIVDSGAEGVVIVAGAVETATLCQHIRKLGSTIRLLTSAWAFTDDLPRLGGPAVEGIIAPEAFDNESRHPEYIRFKAAFQKRFGRAPDFASLFAYEAAMVLFQAMKHAEKGEGLKKAILRQRVYEGVQGEIVIDRYGDTKRRNFLGVIENGRIRNLE